MNWKKNYQRRRRKMVMENEIVSDEYNEIDEIYAIVQEIQSKSHLDETLARKQYKIFQKYRFNAQKIDNEFFMKLIRLYTTIDNVSKENLIGFPEFVFHSIFYNLSQIQFSELTRLDSKDKIDVAKFILVKCYISYLYLQNCSMQQIQTEIGKRVKNEVITRTIKEFRKNLESYLQKYFCIDAIDYHVYCFVINERDYEHTINLQQITKTMNEKEHRYLDSYFIYYYDLKYDRQRILPLKVFPHKRKSHIIITSNLLDAKSQPIESVMDSPFRDWKKV